MNSKKLKWIWNHKINILSQTRSSLEDWFIHWWFHINITPIQRVKISPSTITELWHDTDTNSLARYYIAWVLHLMPVPLPNAPLELNIIVCHSISIIIFQFSHSPSSSTYLIRLSLPYFTWFPVSYLIHLQYLHYIIMSRTAPQ